MFMNHYTFGIRDEARQLIEEYIAQADLSMFPSPMMLEEQSHTLKKKKVSDETFFYAKRV
jgi:hypothetical protein